MNLKAYLSEANSKVVSIIAALAAFGTYSCMYAFRKPFTAATFEGLSWFGVDYKIWLIFSQTIGYTLAKFYGVKFISEMKPPLRAKTILILIGTSLVSLLIFPLIPQPFNIAVMALNGFPLGMVWGLVFSYLEGRKNTEFMGAVLAISFIFSSGFVKTAGSNLMVNYGISSWWMPFFTGMLFVLPLLLFVFLLDQTPDPNEEDIRMRKKRLPMNQKDRRQLLKSYSFGISTLVLAYIILTLLRDFRDNFVSNIWEEQGLSGQPSLFTQTEIPISLVVLIVVGLMVLVRSNINALMINHWLIILGFIMIFISTYLFSNQIITVIPWMMIIGTGLYIAYVPFNCVIFERFMAVFGKVGNAGFLIYVADSFGYLGSVSFLFYKELFGFKNTSWTLFFQNSLLITSVIGGLLTLLAAFYFQNKYKKEYLVLSVKL